LSGGAAAREPQRAVQLRGVHAHPAEDEHEADQLEGGQRDHTEQEDDDRAHEHTADGRGGAQDPGGVVTSADRDDDQHPKKRQHDAGRGAVVPEHVDVHRNRADRRQVHAR
jgi:hypothetical protein